MAVSIIRRLGLFGSLRGPIVDVLSLPKQAVRVVVCFYVMRLMPFHCVPDVVSQSPQEAYRIPSGAHKAAPVASQVHLAGACAVFKCYVCVCVQHPWQECFEVTPLPQGIRYSPMSRQVCNRLPLEIRVQIRSQVPSRVIAVSSPGCGVPHGIRPRADVIRLYHRPSLR